MITIRNATLDDVDAIHALNHETCRKVACFGPLTREYVVANIAGFIVALDGGCMIGNGQIVRLQIDDTSEIRSMCVEERYQGRGVGSGILEALAKKATTKRVIVECTPQNRTVYERCGFLFVATLQDIFRERRPADLYEAIKNLPALCSRFPGSCPGMMLSRTIE